MAQSLETLRSNNVTPIYGRRLGLQQDETLAGPKELKLAIEDITTTVPTTALAYGMTRVQTSGSSQGPTQHFLPAPIPGVRKIIAFTSFAMRGDRERIMAAGFDGCLTKPVDTRQLPGMIREWLGEEGGEG